jgi:hypothetical protein
MKRIAYFLILFLFSINIYAQEIKLSSESDVPAAVLSSFKDKFAPEGKVSWYKDAETFCAKFKSDDQSVVADFSSDGKWIDTKYMVEEKELPSEIATYISTDFKDAKIKEASLRESKDESDHYYIILKKEKTTSVAELYFDVKGTFLKKNVPDEFTNTVSDQSAGSVPAVVLAAFKTKLPDAVLSNWKEDGSFYTAYFVNDEMNGRAEFASDGVWNYTKYTVSEKELPGPAMTDYKSNYSLFKIKTCEMVQEPGTTDYYYIFAKKDGIGQPSIELYYSLGGKFIKKVSSVVENNDVTNEVKDDDADNTDVVDNTSETISYKELPSAAISYIKKNYYGYAVKEASMSTADDVTTYYVKIKKEGKKAIIDLSFDMNGKCLTKDDKEE